jgi:subtilase-type serine protease
MRARASLWKDRTTTASSLAPAVSFITPPPVGGGISLTASDNNTITVGGTINSNGISTSGISTSGGATGNLITILSTGYVKASTTGGKGIWLDDGGNTVDNSGTIFAAGQGIVGSAGTDTVINAGSIAGAFGTAIDLAGGADSLTLKTGSSINGQIDLGAGTDTLTFQGAGTLSSNVVGAESVIMNGSLWTMAGNLTGGGTIDVQAGKFVLNGNASAYDVTVQNGGAFGGTGTAQSLTANSGGIIAPGNSIGTTNFGNVTFNAGSIYQVEVASNGTSDLIKATGTATINGGTVQVIPLGAGFQANTQYTILTAAGGVTGTFNTLALNFPLLTGLLTYDPNNVYFMLQQTAGFSLLALTPNQFAAANALDQAGLAGVSGPLSTAMNTLAVNNAAGVQAGLDDLAGQILADSRRFTVDQASGFHRFVWGAGIQSSGEVVRVSASPTSSHDPIGGHLKAPKGGPSPSVWFGTYGNWDRVSSTSVAFGTNTTVGGAALGVDIWRTPTLLIGAAAGASTGQLKSAGRPDSVDANAGHGAVYARGDVGAFSVNAIVSYAFAALDTSRSISFVNQIATGSTNAHTLGASFGISTIVDLVSIKVEPFANLDWFSSRHNGFAETGAPGVNQLVNGGSYDLFQGTAGARFKHRTALSDGRTFDISATVAVRQDFNGRAAGMTTAFEGAPGIPFTITGVEHDRTAAILGGQIGYNITRATSLYAGYEAELAPDRNRHALQGAIRTRF